ncbi:MAG: ESPR-type extended signal peptide-containing protein, partial [Acinetobacter sp.]
MNKVFKVIFNKSLGRMVIVSENAKSHGKAKSTQNTKNQSVASKIKVIKPLIVISSLFLSPYVFAGNIVQSLTCSNNTMPSIQLTYRINGSNASAQYIGGSYPSSAIADFADNAVSIGSDCSNLNWALSNAVAIGGAAASISGVAIGTGALAYDEYNVAMGSQAKARGKNSVALGANSVTDRANTFAV